MKKPIKRPLSLALETVRILDADHLRAVVGGSPPRTANSKPAVCSTGL